VVTVTRVTTEAEFQAVVDWWNYQREREIFHRWGYMGRTLDSMFPLPQEFRTRREETEAALRPYVTRGEIWVCRDREGRIHHVCVFQIRPDQHMAVDFWGRTDADYMFTVPPDFMGEVPPGVEEHQWDGAPRAAIRIRLRIGNPFEAALRQVVLEDLAGRGVLWVEFREVYGSYTFGRAVITQTPIGFDKWTRKQRYRVLVHLPTVLNIRAANKQVQAQLREAEAL